MLNFNLREPVKLLLFGTYSLSFAKHLTRTLLEYELFVVTKGTLFVTDEKKEYEVKEGEYLIMRPNSLQRGAKNCNCSFYWLHFDAPTDENCEGLSEQGKVTNLMEIERIFEKLFECDSKKDKLYASYVATELLLEIKKQNAHELAEEENSVELCEKITDYVNKNKNFNLKIFEIADALGYHEKYISHVFHNVKGQTLKNYVTQVRIDEAKKLLLYTEYKVSEITYFLNFPNPHIFSRFFKLNTGYTPTDYRKIKR